MTEEILAKIDTTGPKTLYFTSDRVIVAKVWWSGVLSVLLILIGGFLMGNIAMRKRAKKTEELGKLSPESILSAHAKNFAIPYTEITRVELMGDRKVTITAGETRHQFSAARQEEFEGCFRILHPVLGDKLSLAVTRGEVEVDLAKWGR